MQSSDVVLDRRTFIKGGTLMLTAGVLEAGTGLALLAGEAPPQPLLKVGILTDVHYADKEPAINRYYRESLGKTREAVERFNADNVDFIVELGDIIDSAPSVPEETAALSRIRAELSRFKGDCFFALGNHCVSALTKEEFLKGFGAGGRETFHSFDRGPYHFVVLDGCFRADGEPYSRGNFRWTDSDIPTVEQEWLRRDLASTSKPCVLFVHQRLDCEDAHAVKSAAAVREILEKSGRVAAVFQGHSHKNDYRKIGAIHYCTLRAMVEGSGEAKSGYGILNLFKDGSIYLAGFRDQAERRFPMPRS